MKRQTSKLIGNTVNSEMALLHKLSLQQQTFTVTPPTSLLSQPYLKLQAPASFSVQLRATTENINNSADFNRFNIKKKNKKKTT